MKALFSIQNWFLENVGSIDLETIENWFVYNPKQPLLFNSALFLGLFLIFYAIYILSRKTHYFRITYVVLFSIRCFILNPIGIILIFFWSLFFSVGEVIILMKLDKDNVGMFIFENNFYIFWD